MTGQARPENRNYAAGRWANYADILEKQLATEGRVAASYLERAVEAEASLQELREALGSVRTHSLLQIRRAAFAPEIGVRYTEKIRAAIAGECAKLEQFIEAKLKVGA